MSEFQSTPRVSQHRENILSFSVSALAVAIALGLIGAAFAEVQLRNCLGVSGYSHSPLLALFGAVVFAAEWCSENGPPRWRPIVITEERLRNISAFAVAMIVAAGIVILYLRSPLRLG